MGVNIVQDKWRDRLSRLCHALSTIDELFISTRVGQSQFTQSSRPGLRFGTSPKSEWLQVRNPDR